MTGKDKKEMAQLVGEVIDQKVTPRLKKLDEKADATMEMTAKNTEDVVELNERFDKVDERFDEVDASLNRIETLVTSEVKYVDDLSNRVVKLEKKPA